MGLQWSLFVALAGVMMAAAPPGHAAEPSHRVVREGVAVELALEPLDPRPGGELREGDPVTFRFAVSDVATGTPLTSVYPAAWMHPLAPGETPSAERCVEKVEEFLGGNVFNRAELDLNVYYVLALNHDATITVVDPLFGYGGTRLLAMVLLESPGEDWELTRDQRTLFVSQPEAGKVAVVDTAAWEVRRQVDAGPRPARLALQDDEAYLWVVTGETLAAVDTGTLAVDARIPLGPPPHDMVLGDDDRFIFVTQGDGTVAVVDVPTLKKLGDVATGGSGAASIDYSPAARRAWAAYADGRLAAIDGRHLEAVARLEAPPGLGRLRFAPGGRYGFVVNPDAGALYVLDAALGRIVQTGAMDGGPLEVGFSDELVYVLHRDNDTVLMIPLDEIGREGAAIPVVDFPGGQVPFGHGRPSPADRVVPAPGAPAVLVANPGDQMIYYYKEGMAAPMGGFKNYGREPRAVEVVDRSLRQRRQPGVYETTARLRRPGRYELAFYLDAPRMVHCFPAVVAPDPELERARRAALPARVEPLFTDGRVTAGEAVKLRYRLRDPETGEVLKGLDDVRVMVYTTDNRSRRDAAVEVEEGVYEVEFVPEAGTSYLVAVECPSRRLAYHQAPQVNLYAEETP